MGLGISELDTMDATEHMARSWRHWTLCGGKHTGFPSDNAHHLMQRSSGSQYTICPKKEATTSEPTALDSAANPSPKLDMETSRRLRARTEGNKKKKAVSGMAQNQSQQVEGAEGHDE